MADVACWDSLESVFHEEFKYEIGTVILCDQYGSASYADPDRNVLSSPSMFPSFEYCLQQCIAARAEVVWLATFDLLGNLRPK